MQQLHRDVTVSYMNVPWHPGFTFSSLATRLSKNLALISWARAKAVIPAMNTATIQANCSVARGPSATAAKRPVDTASDTARRPSDSYTERMSRHMAWRLDSASLHRVEDNCVDWRGRNQDGSLVKERLMLLNTILLFGEGVFRIVS